MTRRTARVLSLAALLMLACVWGFSQFIAVGLRYGDWALTANASGPFVYQFYGAASPLTMVAFPPEHPTAWFDYLAPMHQFTASYAFVGLP